MGEVVALLGAAGKMGTRISSNLAKTTTYEVLCVEATGAGEERLRAHGFVPIPLWDAVPRADIVVMAIPDVLISSMTRTVVPQMKNGTLGFRLPRGGYPVGVVQGHFHHHLCARASDRVSLHCALPGCGSPRDHGTQCQKWCRGTCYHQRSQVCPLG